MNLVTTLEFRRFDDLAQIQESIGGIRWTLTFVIPVDIGCIIGYRLTPSQAGTLCLPRNWIVV